MLFCRFALTEYTCRTKDQVWGDRPWQPSKLLVAPRAQAWKQCCKLSAVMRWVIICYKVGHVETHRNLAVPQPLHMKHVRPQVTGRLG